MKNQLSLVICTYNRDKFIADCLNSINHQTLANDLYEVLLINNNCTDLTESIVNNYIADNPTINIRQIMEPNQGLSFARNRGIKESTSELICYVDDDAILPATFLETVVDIMQENQNYAGIGGKVIPEYETKQPDWYHSLLRMFVTHIDYGESMFKCYGKKYPPGCNMTYRKNILLQCGGFNNALKWRTDDKYIFFEVRKLNDNIYYRPELWVRHQIDADRITDKNFDKLSIKLGEEERIRITSNNKLLLFPKIIEYLIKYLATFAMFPVFALKGKSIIGRYIIRFRYLALKGLFIN